MLTHGSEDVAGWLRDDSLVRWRGKEGARVSAGSGPRSCPLPSASWLRLDPRGCGCVDVRPGYAGEETQGTLMETGLS